MDYKDRLPSREEEIESIKRYCGFYHARINILSDMDPTILYEMQSKGWSMNINSSNLEELITDFVNIYGKIYSEGDRKSILNLYRGTTNDELSNITKGEEIAKSLSTTHNQNIAKTFCEYGNAAIAKINIKSGLPYLHTEQFKDGKDEEEVLLLPFSKVTECRFSNDYNGYKYYDISLEKCDLPEIEDGELDELKQQAKSGIDEFVNQSKEYMNLYYEIDSLFARLKNTGLDIEDKRYLIDRQSELSEKRYELGKNINKYRENFLKMLKGLCKQREKDKDQEREVKREKEAKEAEERKRKREQERQERLERGIQGFRREISANLQNIEEELSKNVDKLENNMKLYIKTANNLGLQSFNNNSNIMEIKSKASQIIEELRRAQKEISEEGKKQDEKENRDEKYGELEDQKTDLQEARSMLEDMPGMIEIFSRESISEIKSTLNEKVQDLVYRSEYHALQWQRENVAEEKETIFQKIFGRNDLKDAKLRNLDAKMRLAYRRKETRNPSNSVNKMLQDIYDCSYKYYGGRLTPEMQNVVDNIRTNFKNLRSEQDLMEQAVINSNNNGLAIIENKKPSLVFGMFNRKKVREIDLETSQLQSDIRDSEGQISQMNYLRQGSQLPNKYYNIQNLLSNIKQKVRIDNSDIDADQRLKIELDK